MSPARRGHATYLYCLVQRATAPTLRAGPAGLPGTDAPRAIAVAPSLWLVAGDAPLDRYDGAAIERRLHDLDWVSACALAHEGVVVHVAAQGTTVPMKLFTLFTSDDRAVAHVRRRRRSLARVIRRIAGRQEWGVRIRVVAAPVERRPRGRAPSGAQFLRRKLAERKSRERRASAAAPVVRRALARLGAIGDAMRRQPIPIEGSGVSGLVVDAVFLVRVARRNRFTVAVRDLHAQLGESGYDVTLTGPWPPYNFIPARGSAK
jgi:hypothetical protein